MHCAINWFILSKLMHEAFIWIATKSDRLNIFVGFLCSHAVSDTVKVQPLVYILSIKNIM